MVVLLYLIDFLERGFNRFCFTLISLTLFLQNIKLVFQYWFLSFTLLVSLNYFIFGYRALCHSPGFRVFMLWKWWHFVSLRIIIIRRTFITFRSYYNFTSILVILSSGVKRNLAIWKDSNLNDLFELVLMSWGIKNDFKYFLCLLLFIFNFSK